MFHIVMYIYPDYPVTLVPIIVFAHPGVTCLQTSIPTSCSASTIPWIPLYDSLLLSPPTPFFLHPQQGCPKLPLFHLFPPPCVPPATPSPHSLSRLRTLPILAAALPTVRQLPTVSLCRSFPTVFPLLPVLLPSRASPMSRMETAAPAST